MSGPRPSELRCFNENSPRPPVPGEEREGYVDRCHSSSPDPQPRRSTCDATCASLGFEPEGRCDRAFMEERSDSTSPLACLQWTRSLHALLEDPKGLELFEHYLQQEGHIYALSFWFACEGLKEERDPTKLTAIIKVLIRRFFQRPQLALPEEVRKEMTRRFREGLADKRMFDLAQQEVERLIEETTYPNFLRSDVYLQYVRYCQCAEAGSGGGDGIGGVTGSVPRAGREIDEDEDAGVDNNECPSSPDEPSLSCASNLLPTLHEDSEFTSQQNQQQHHVQTQHHQSTTTAGASASTTTTTTTATEFNKGEMRLTKDMLMATQQLRALDIRPKPEAFAGDGASMAKRNTRKQYIRQYQAIKKSAMINRDPVGHESIIPRTQRVSREQTQPMNPESFARQLIEKLERVQRDRETEEKLERKLKEVDLSNSHSDSLCETSSLSNVMHQSATAAPASSRSLADALREKLQLEEDNDQAILDQHVSRVWSDLTPSRSPKLASPRPRSPDKSRRQQQQHHHQQQQHQQAMAAAAAVAHQYPTRPSSYRSQRKEKDVFSTFSGDSGNVHDFPEAGELHGAGSMSSLGSHLPKSKSVPSDYAGSLHKQDLYLQGQDQRYRRLDAARSSATKKSMTELTDSGVSVVSDVPPAAVKDSRLLNWFKETDGSSGSGKVETNVNAKLNRKKFNNLPQQPFVGDPGMPLLPQPHTATQLEEAKRRLEYEQNRNRQRYPSSSGGSGAKQMQDYELMPPMQTVMQSNQSTLRRTKQDAPSDFTTVVFSFCDEKVPYRTKIAGYNVTLKQFKDVLPKKGSYRYFFKTECEDLDMKVIQEEITDDSEVLPLWEGKVMAQVKALE